VEGAEADLARHRGQGHGPRSVVLDVAGGGRGTIALVRRRNRGDSVHVPLDRGDDGQRRLFESEALVARSDERFQERRDPRRRGQGGLRERPGPPAEGAVDGVVGVGGQAEDDAIVASAVLVGTRVGVALVAEHQPTGTEHRLAPGVAVGEHAPVDQRDRERDVLLVLRPAGGGAAATTVSEAEPARLLQGSVECRRFGGQEERLPQFLTAARLSKFLLGTSPPAHQPAQTRSALGLEDAKEQKRLVVALCGERDESKLGERSRAMAILLVLGVMDLLAMAVVAAAITVERLAPAGERAARVVGAVAVGQG